MKVIADTFTKNGFDFNLVKRAGSVAIFAKRERGCPDEVPTYETVVVRNRKEREAFGVTFEAGEFYPSNEEWGVFGWTYYDLAGAEAKLLSLLPIKAANGVTP